MAYGKFATITSSLLARKGEAMPWNESGKAPLPWRMETPIAIPPQPEPTPRLPLMAVRPAPAPAQDAEAVRRCTVRMTQRDYERLGIMAVKKDVTRQQFLHEALARVLDEIAREFPSTCACIGEGCGACGKGSQADI
jgi:hypothetical protein